MATDFRPPAFYTPLRYPGGKGKLVPYVKRILELNNLVDGVYIEPYAGGAAVAIELLLQEYVKKIFINDISPGVAAFWRSVLDNTDALCAKISGATLTIKEWHIQKEVQCTPGEHEDLVLGFATFYLNRTNRSGILSAGVIGGKEQNGKWKMDARFNGPDLINRIQKIARVRNRIEFFQKDALNFLDTVTPLLPQQSLIYLDPPYYVKGCELYLHHYQHDDHIKIAKRIAKIKNKNWLVSYDNTREIKEMYSNFRGIEYGLSYSAQDRYKGAEVMFFSDNIQIPDPVRPMHLASAVKPVSVNVS